MRRKKKRLATGFLLLSILPALLSCTTDKAKLQIKNSLPQDELAYYSDNFDKMREDLWDRAGYLYHEEQLKNFKQADMRFDNGRLIILTKTGSFSKGGLSSKYSFKGDFDIQLKCRMDFVKGIPGMDQVLSIGVFDKNLRAGKLSAAIINLHMEEGYNQGYLGSTYLVNGSRKKWRSQKTENFNGAFRFLRIGKTISTLYQITGSPEWTKMLTFKVTDQDMLIGFQLRNFVAKRTIIRAGHSISAEFDSIQINAAQEIIEEEI